VPLGSSTMICRLRPQRHSTRPLCAQAPGLDPNHRVDMWVEVLLAPKTLSQSDTPSGKAGDDPKNDLRDSAAVARDSEPWSAWLPRSFFNLAEKKSLSVTGTTMRHCNTKVTAVRICFEVTAYYHVTVSAHRDFPVTQKTDRRHHNFSSVLVWVADLFKRRSSLAHWMTLTKRQWGEEFGGCSAADCWFQQVAVNSVFGVEDCPGGARRC